MTMERAAAGRLRRVVTAFPTNASAQDAEMSLADYEDFVYRAGFLDDEDPVASWQALGEKLARLAGKWLGTKALRVVTEGTDLTVGVEGARGSRATAGRISRTARSSPAPSRPASREMSLQLPRPHAGRLAATSSFASRAARSSRLMRAKARISSGRCSRWTRAPVGWANSRSE